MRTQGDHRMIEVPAGRVTLSDRRTRRSWAVDVGAFALGAAPVTRGLYEQVTGTAPSTAHGDLRPVEEVSWDDAIRFCDALSVREGLRPAYRSPADGSDSGAPDWDRTADGYRLPTEAEWEHACRAGTTEARYGPLDEIAWHRGNSGERLHEVGGRRPNDWGLHDMLGNVWEWCWDRYDPEVYGSYRVLRGGGWFDEHWSCRASVRRRSHPTLRIDDVGFRLARTLPGRAGR
ncbi:MULTISPECIES: SUMF1/EgtB/PvdO family nonheme iron enzyme [unclassified Streptomyces]|uniref:formylglycine-generating enzyme family protein n=1 Tax=unclassified Streptomyces TaxID=2593676 RepID=UPI001E5C2F71|nr:SUMF1/EgtB/PvdO family nonheme iron enzyme [Streptomyces sp. MBT42]MCD2462905.1 formylglycine-generating enzyme family protein [Streptomyces sp. MBT42]